MTRNSQIHYIDQNSSEMAQNPPQQPLQQDCTQQLLPSPLRGLILTTFAAQHHTSRAPVAKYSQFWVKSGLLLGFLSEKIPLVASKLCFPPLRLLACFSRQCSLMASGQLNVFPHPEQTFCSYLMRAVRLSASSLSLQSVKSSKSALN